MATRVNMSEVLDNIAWRPGSMLFRNGDYWTEIPPGLEGYVLYFNGLNTAPEWRPPETGGGGGGWFTPPATTASTSSINSKGTWFVPWVAFSIRQIICSHVFASGELIRLVMARCNSSGVVQELLIDETMDWGPNGTQQYDFFEPQDPINLAAGQYYAIMACLPNRGNTFINPIMQGGSYVASAPLRETRGYATAANNNLQVGDTIGLNVGNSYCMGFSIGEPVE